MKKFGLIGFPLTHSFSKKYFGEKFSKENINDCRYDNYEIDSISKLKQVINNTPELVGLNVTIPYKQEVIPFLDEIHDAAKEIKAVNTIKILRENSSIKLQGFNSDVYGFRESINPFLKSHHKKALILGTGGASKAIEYTFANLGISSKFVTRTEKPHMLTYEQLNKSIMDEYGIIVNCSPLGTFPKVDNCPNIPYEFITENHLLFDLVYNPEVTLFLQKGENKGAAIKNGLEMLHLQAEKSWSIWNS